MPCRARRTPTTRRNRCPAPPSRGAGEATMAGVYGEINSRDDFFRLIDEARAITGGMLKAQPRNWTIESIDTQLDAMKRWTAGGRVPTQDERKSIKIGLLAVRELD